MNKKKMKRKRKRVVFTIEETKDGYIIWGNNFKLTQKEIELLKKSKIVNKQPKEG